MAPRKVGAGAITGVGSSVHGGKKHLITFDDQKPDVGKSPTADIETVSI